MKRFFSLILASACGVAAAPFWGGAADAAAAENEVQVVKSGKSWGTVESYRVGDDFYFPAKSAARIYGAQLYWYAVRGTVRLSFRGRQLLLSRDAAEALVEGKPIALPKPMIVRAGSAFIPVEFFASPEFAAVAGVDSKFDPKTRVLIVDGRSTVGPVRWFTYPDHTRIVLELDGALRFQTAQRGKSGLDVAVPNGRIESPLRVDVSDGVLDSFALNQEKMQSRLTLKMQGEADGYKILELQNPRRLVIDVARSRDAVLEAKNRRVGFEAPAPPASSPEAAPASTPAAAAVPAAAPAGANAAPAASALAGGKERIRIVIDPGHGGKDGGAVGRRGTLEKDINLAASLELAEMLRGEGVFEVLLTRSTDEFIKLNERSKRANDFNADLFVSVHCNAAGQRALSGFEVYFLSERASDPEAQRLAEFENSVLALEGEDPFEDDAAMLLYGLARTEFINDAAELAGLMTRSLSALVDLRNRGVKQAAFYVLRGANQPAVLVELAFLSNAGDESKLRSDKYRLKLVEGMRDGILDFFRRKGRLEKPR